MNQLNENEPQQYKPGVNDEKICDTISENCRDDLSQFYESSQFLQQLETVIDKYDTKLVDNYDHQGSKTSTVELEESLNSSQYKRDVSNIFSNFETTINEITEAQHTNICNLNSTMNDTNIAWANSSICTVNSIKNDSSEHHKQTNNITNDIQLETTLNISFLQLGSFYGLPSRVKDLIQQYKGINELYDWQHECLSLDAIKNRNNLIYSLPTSGGKTLVSEILIYREILCRRKNVLFVLPYVSIVQEKVWALSPFGLGLEFLVEEYAASKGGYPPRKRRHKHSVYIATIEKALGLVNSLIETNRLNELGLIVVDELHLIGESGRGAKLETLLTKIEFLNENIQIIGMSATIGNLSEICKFLKAHVYSNDFRPVQLKEFIKCGNQLYQINRNAKCKEKRLIPVRTVDFQYSTEINQIDPDQLTGLLMEVAPSGSCLIFCASKKNCENVAKLLCRVIFRTLLEHKKNEKLELLRELHDEGALCPILRFTIPFGVAYHHSGLTSDERQIIENGFRNGTLCCICCTSTLAAGVNLPARRVILRSPYVGREFISLAKYKQMSGRAGRAGFGEQFGESILICEKKDLEKVVDLLCSPMDNVKSQLYDNNAKGLRNLVLSCISLGIATTRRTLREVTSSTLLAVQEECMEITVKNATDEVISDLFKMGAIQLATDNDSIPDRNVSLLFETTLPNASSINIKRTKSDKKQIVIGNNSRLVISKLSKAALKGGFDLETAHLLYDDLTLASRCLELSTCLHLLYLVTPYDLVKNIQPSLSNYYSIYVRLGPKELQTAKVIGLNEACGASMLTGRRIKNVDERVLNRFYLSLVLYDLWNRKNVFDIADKYQVSRGIVQQLMVSAATFTSNVVRFCEEIEEFWHFAYLLRGMALKLQYCATMELEPLMELPAVKLGRARQLYKAGYKTLQKVSRAKPEDLIHSIDHMTYRIASQLIAAAKLLLLERVENLREEAEDILDGINSQQ